MAQTFTDGHGIIVNGPYGMAQWMVQEDPDDIDTLNTYSYSLDCAKKVLEDGGWGYNKDGSPIFKDGMSYFLRFHFIQMFTMISSQQKLRDLSKMVQEGMYQVLFFIQQLANS